MGNGDGPEAYERDVVQELRDVLGDRLHLLGLVPPSRLLQELSMCRAIVAPSREEMFGNQVIEALIAGTHAIVTEDTAMAENVRRFGNGTVVPQEDSMALAKAILSVLEPREFPEAESARTNVIEALAPERIAALHEALYRRVIEGGSGGIDKRASIVH